MKALVLRETSDLTENPEPLSLESVPSPEPEGAELLVRIAVCGVCHTELDEIEGRTPPPELPVIPGHQVVGEVVGVGGTGRTRTGAEADDGGPRIGDRVGVAWIYRACGVCRYCRGGLENLCPRFEATGRDADGGYAELMTVPIGFAHLLPPGLEDARAAPLMCAGAIGYRSLELADVRDGGLLGLTGFGASGHLVLQLVRHLHPRTAVFVFARSAEQREFALELGAAWAGDTEDDPPERLDAIIDTTPAWKPVVAALGSLVPAGRLVVNAIRKEAGDQDELMRLSYARDLWMEKELKSVANVTRHDVREFLRLAAEMGLEPEVEEYPLAEGNRALVELKEGGGRGAKVLRIAH